MPTNIQFIQPRRVDFRTQTNADWLDGMIVWQSGQGGVVAGAANVGNGALTVSNVAPGTPLGAHIVAVTSLDGVPRITVEDPSGNVTGRGVVGVPIYAGGITLTLAPGSVGFAIDDTFAVGVLPVPIDITGIVFTLQARLTQLSANIALSATSSPTSLGIPTIVTGTSGGEIGMRKLRSAMDRSVFPPNTYVYDMLASADGVTVPAFFGTIEHFDGVTFLP